MKYKIAPILIIALAIFAICFSGCDTAYIDNSMYSTTEPTTLSAEEIEKNKIIDIRDSLVNSALPDKYGYSNIFISEYCYLQDYIQGAEKNTEELFFEGTYYYGLSSLYSNTKYYKNKNVLSFLQSTQLYDANYIFCFTANAPNDFGKIGTVAGFVVVKANENDYTWWIFSCGDNFEMDLNYAIIGTITQKVTLHSFGS